MKEIIELDGFLARNRISKEIWKSASIDWSILQEIAKDHETQINSLRDSAEFFARVIQRFEGVHSVRWRIKNTEHMLEKIIRKRAKKEEKYKDINLENYFEIITDLIGIRALHLFKDECFSINRDLLKTWTPSENPIAYLREGDPQGLTNRFEEHGLHVEKHPVGYRSIHYVISTQPLQRRVYAEVQVRTIFEEGWSEIDHRVRYPNFSEDPLVSYFLTIFNRLAGSADEMGTFVQGLTESLQNFESQISDANQQKLDALTAMDKALADLEDAKREGADTTEKLSLLKFEVEKLRVLHSTESAADNHLSWPVHTGERRYLTPKEHSSLEKTAQSMVTHNKYVKLRTLYEKANDLNNKSGK